MLFEVDIIIAKGISNQFSHAGQLPWKSPDDMKYFRETVQNRLVFMGYRTWISLPNKRISNCTNVIIYNNIPIPIERDGIYFVPNLYDGLVYTKHISSLPPIVIGGINTLRNLLNPWITVREFHLSHINYDKHSDTVISDDLIYWLSHKTKKLILAGPFTCE